MNKLTLKSTSTAALIEESLALAREKNLTAYDASYAILARRLKLPFITADSPLAKAVDWAIWIGDFDI